MFDSPGRNWRSKRETCDVGHPLEGENLILRPVLGKPGSFTRACRECGRRRSREYYARKKRTADAATS